MSEDARRAEIAKKTIVLQLPGMDAVEVRRDVRYGEAGTMDVYVPPGLAAGARTPALVFVFGFPDPRFARGLKHMGSYGSWARLVALAGITAITYDYREPVADLATLLAHLRADADALGIDAARVGVWAASGNVPTALGLLMSEAPDAFRCAALLYGYMLDVPEAARAYGLAQPAAGRGIADLPRALPLYVGRAGADQTPGLNASLDAFVADALAHNLPLTLANHPTGPHSYDLFDDSEASRDQIRAVLAFLRHHLVGAADDGAQTK